ncbi:hypothetical protein ACOYR1_05970 [Thalassotalea piscium]
MKLYDPSLRINLNKHNFLLDEFIMLDIEASGLGHESYPIEVAYVSSTGDRNSYLIKSTDEWINDGLWCSDAESSIHKISQDMLAQHGIPPFVVANSLNEALSGKLVLCNDLDYDGVWLTQLFKAANVGVMFSLTDIRYLYEYLGESKTHNFKQSYDAIVPSTIHRALPDAQRFVEAFNMAITSL